MLTLLTQVDRVDDLRVLPYSFLNNAMIVLWFCPFLCMLMACCFISSVYAALLRGLGCFGQPIMGLGSDTLVTHKITTVNDWYRYCFELVQWFLHDQGAGMMVQTQWGVVQSFDSVLIKKGVIKHHNVHYMYMIWHYRGCSNIGSVWLPCRSLNRSMSEALCLGICSYCGGFCAR